jgi:Prophage tail length tape measure protein
MADDLVFAMDANIKKLTASLAAAEARVTGTARKIDAQFANQNRAVSAGLAKSAEGFKSLGQISGAQRFVLQNFSNQLGDIAVQLASGTSAARTLGQQLPQMLGGFGALGGTLGLVGPLLGTVAAIGIPVAAALFAMGGSAEETTEKVETFEQRLRSTQAALKEANSAIEAAAAGGLDDLRKKYGEVTVAVTELASALEGIAIAGAGKELGGLVDAIFPDLKGRPEQIRQAVSDYDRLIRRQQEVLNLLSAPASLSQPDFDALDRERKQLEGQLAALKPIRDELNAIGDKLNLLPQEAGGLAIALSQARDAIKAKDFEAAAAALAAMREYAQTLGINLGEEVLGNITAAEDAARQMAAQLAESAANATGVAGAAGDIKPPISAAADEAGRLSGNLASALALLAGITSGLATAERRATNQAAAIRAAGGDPVKKAAGLAREDFNEKTGGAAFELIRSGNTGSLGRISDLSERTAAQAAQEVVDAAAAAALDKAFGGGGGKKGGGGGKAATSAALGDKEIAQLQQRIDLLGQTTRETAELEAKYQLLDEAKRAGLDLDKQVGANGETLRDEINAQAAAIADLTVEYEHAKERSDFFASAQKTLKDGFLDAISSGKDFGDTLKTLAQMLKRAAAEALIFGTGPLAGGGGGKGGGLFGSLGSIIAGLFHRAGGGSVQGGVPYLVNEGTARSEVFVPSASGAILNVGQAQRALASSVGAGAQAVDVRVIGGDLTLTDGGQVSARMAVTARAARAGAVQDVQRGLPGWQRQLDTNGRLSG